MASDIDKKALESAKESAAKEKIKRIRFVHSDLFSKIKGKFDTIIFNPPYLPSNQKYPDVALDGGKKGYELIGRFISQANAHLEERGRILIVFSSLTKKDKVGEILEKYLFGYKEVAEQKIFFETLYVYLIAKSKLLLQLRKNKIKNIEKLAKGHRGIVYTGVWKNKKIAIKAEKGLKAKGRAKNEAKWLRALNRNGIGPKLLFSGRKCFVYEFAEGDFILDYLAKAQRKEILSVLERIFYQLLILDRLKVNKEEMHHPVKHIIVGKSGKPVLIDFERCRKTEKPKNVTQFCQFLIGDRARNILAGKGIKIKKKKAIEFAKSYRAAFTARLSSRKMRGLCSSSDGRGISILQPGKR